ncbi:MAG: enoyl-CoA hydratase [Deltaproteobacteria bacterium]|nr:MAG: enoyl-CoA hydratase [Deltaproteobacteria bacterium]
MSDHLVFDTQEGVGYLVINREDRRNAISQEMIANFHEYLDKMKDDKSVRAVCITAAGNRIFCSGADLGATLVKKDGTALEGARNYASLLKKMTEYEKPLVAKVNGPCLAGGLGLMLACDLVIARDDAYFCTPEVKVGIFPMMVGALLLRHIGLKRTMDMVLTARKVTAAEAVAIGLVTRVVPPETLDHEVAELLKALAQRSPIGIKIGKRAFRETWDMPFEQAVDHLCNALGEVISTQDAAEGMRAFLEKRKPVFKGR